MRVPLVAGGEAKSDFKAEKSKALSRLKSVFSGSSKPGLLLQSQFLYTCAASAARKFGQVIAGSSSWDSKTVIRQIKHPWDAEKACGSIIMTALSSQDVSRVKTLGAHGYLKESNEVMLRFRRPAGQAESSFPPDACKLPVERSLQEQDCGRRHDMVSFR